MYFIEICYLTTKWHLWCPVYAGENEIKRKRESARNGEERTHPRPPSHDMSAMCADETGRCAKPGFDRHLSSYQHARRNCNDPVPVPRSSPASHKCENYIRGLSQAAALSPRVIHDRTVLDPRMNTFNHISPLDNFANKLPLKYQTVL